MTSSKRKFAVVPAGGSGSRMGTGGQKLLLALSGQPIIFRTIERLISAVKFETVVVPCREEDAEILTKLFAHLPQIKFCRGGAHRQESVLRGLMFLEQNARPLPDEVVVIHDAARCLVEASMIRETIEWAEKGIAAAVGVSVKDTLKRVNESQDIVATVPRENLIAVQTPQTFPFEIILTAHRGAEGQQYTDDAAIVEQHQRVHWVSGAATNLKITSPEDLVLAEALLALRA